MNLAEIFSLAFEALGERKTRAILTILMVVVGSSLMVVLNGLSAGQSQFLKDQLNQLGTDVLYVTSGQRSFRGESPPSSIIMNNVVATKISSLQYVEEVIPQYRSSVQVSTQGNNINTSVYAMNPEKLLVISPNVKFMENSVIKQNDPSAILVGYNIANPPGATNQLITVGQTIKATFTYVDNNGDQQKESKIFVVTGIMELTGSNQIDQSVYINEQVGNTFLHKGGKYDTLVVRAKSSDLVDSVQTEITDLYGSNIGVTSPRSVMAIREQFTSGNNSFILSVGVIALVVGAVGIITTLYTSVTERIREIGTMKAIGAQSKVILALFLMEALLIGLFGATLGIIIGVGAGYTLGSAISPQLPGRGSISPIFLPDDLIKVWLLSVALSIGAGIYPAWRASRLPPIVALRTG